MWYGTLAKNGFNSKLRSLKVCRLFLYFWKIIYCRITTSESIFNYTIRFCNWFSIIPCICLFEMTDITFLSVEKRKICRINQTESKKISSQKNNALQKNKNRTHSTVWHAYMIWRMHNCEMNFKFEHVVDFFTKLW